MTASDAVAPSPHVLVVDDDPRLASLLGRFLSGNGFVVSTAADAEAARQHLGLMCFDLLIIDVMMPGEDGLSLTRAVRTTSSVPILMLTARGQTDDRVLGLESGADDYLAKPFDPRELLLRVRGLLRRMRETPEPPASAAPTGGLPLGAYVFDLERQELRRGEAPVHLTTGELALLRVLAERRGEALSREDLAALTGAEGNPRAIDVQVTRLRKKIDDDPRAPRYLRTVRGKGYQLTPG
ncbi:response regulator [Pararhodospirillum photometricum]|uniref:Two component transcriptional regulator, winged helix family n=1 Tax=Pararhodospirillum photometricum DSM 122 TaxID=1150469 RepID=H6SL50_PARPM|nr:response regulator [Pararhodospirillum photometricum]CCG08715.1 Two component transcriptional regulator, winged helix family [Pararhodospirillum photometricum DSM 122]